MDGYLLDAFKWVAVDHPTPAIVTVFGGLVWYVRSRLQHSWAIELERVRKALQSQIDADRADLQAKQAAILAQQQRELEAYKVSLISETERVRAAQDVAKAVALKVGERRFTAIADLHDAVAGLDTDATTFATMTFDSPDDLAKEHGLVVARVSALILAHERGLPFLTIELRRKSFELLAKAGVVIALRSKSEQPLPRDHAAVASCLAVGNELDRELSGVLAAYEGMAPLPGNPALP